MGSELVQKPYLPKPTGTICEIPVGNIWLLMLYASELYRARGLANVAIEESPEDIPDLISEILCSLVEKRIKRNLSYGYQNREAVVARLRGRIDLLKTFRHRLLERGRAACRFDEMTINTPRNRYVKAALVLASRVVKNNLLAHRCRSLAFSLWKMGVDGDCPLPNDLSINRYGRHDMDDQPMTSAARLVFDLALPTELSGLRNLLSPDRDIHWFRKLYEKAIAGFYAVVLADRGWRVDAGTKLEWQITKKSEGIDRILPGMKTDIILTHPKSGRRIVIDTKFTSIVKQGQYREETLSSGYLYQIHTYLRSQELDSDPLSKTAEGLLLHPTIGKQVFESLVTHGHEIRFSTVDLMASAKEIRSQFLKVIGLSEEPMD